MRGSAVVLLLLGASPAFGVPSVSGVSGSVVDAQSITITGAGFGSKGTATPALFDTFDTNDAGRQAGDHVYGQSASHYGAWTNSFTDAIATYSSSNQRTNSALSTSVDIICADTNNNQGYIIGDFSPAHTGSALVSMWSRVSQVVAIEGAGNLKIWKLCDGSGLVGDGNCSAQDTFDVNRAPNDGYAIIFGADGSVVSWPATGDGTLDHAQPYDTWYQTIAMKVAGDNATANGTEVWIINGVTLEDTNVATNWWTGEAWRQALFGFYCANYSAGTVRLQFDDIYVDTSIASVWIGDAATWAGCTQREVQIPSAWADGSISVTVNRGAFAADATAYLYVVDGMGSVNANGYGVTFGSTPSPGTGAVTSTSGTGSATSTAGAGSVTCQQ